MKAKYTSYSTEEEKFIVYDCPGCKENHQIPVTESRAWGFNGSLDSPTLTPSILASREKPGGPDTYRCHHFVKDGKIQYLQDCNHEMKGMTIEMEEL